MAKTDELVLKAIDELLHEDLKDMVQFTVDDKQRAPIKISLRGKRISPEKESFFDRVSRFSHDYFEQRDKLTSRILKDMTKFSRKKSKSGKTQSLYIFFRDTNKEYIDTDFSDIKEIENKPVTELKKEEACRLLEEVFITWRDLPARHRQPKTLAEKSIVGYFKQREMYSHREIIEGIQTYGKWALARQKAVDAGDIDSIWFHSWNLDQFLRSNTAMGHVDGGWKQVIQDKKIPKEYLEDIEERQLDFRTDEEKAKQRAASLLEMAEDMAKGNPPLWPALYEKYKPQVDEMVKEIKDGQS